MKVVVTLYIGAVNHTVKPVSMECVCVCVCVSVCSLWSLISYNRVNLQYFFTK